MHVLRVLQGPAVAQPAGRPYLLTLDDIAERSREAFDQGATEVCLQGGIHPDFDGDFYVDVVRAVKEAAPQLHIHGVHRAGGDRRRQASGRVAGGLPASAQGCGLSSLPGTAAEILDDDIRAVLCPDKINTDEWLEAHRVAHQVGLRSNITIMFGSVEQPVHWAGTSCVPLTLQRETGGFTEFVGLPFVHMAAPIYLKRGARRGPTWRETVLMHAVARIAYHGLHRQHPGIVGEARADRRQPTAASRGQRPRRHLDGREHQPSRRVRHTARRPTRRTSPRWHRRLDDRSGSGPRCTAGARPT